jgi:hypothetical protein
MSLSNRVKEFMKMFQMVSGTDDRVKPEDIDWQPPKINVPTNNQAQVEQQKRVNKTQEESIQEMFQRMFAADQIRKAKEQERLKNQMEQDVEKQQQSVRIDEENQSEIESRLTGSSSRKLRI